MAKAPSPSRPTSDHADLMKVREGVWRAWFAGDRKALLAILPEDFAGISLGEGAARTRDQVVKDAQDFAASGNRLTDLRFPENHVQVIGPVRVIYCTFSFTYADKTGKTTTAAGRATEVFVRQGQRWSHPGWHLDSGR